MKQPNSAQKAAAKKIGIAVSDYLALVNAGQKWCYGCKRWRRVELFNVDRSRGDGRVAACIDCKSVKTADGPRIVERKMNAVLGIAWCSGCRRWLQKALIRGGKCNGCTRAYERSRYAQDESYRAERRQHSHSRSRGVAPIPVDAQHDLLEQFNGECAYCTNKADSWDHIFPVSRGGKTENGNIVPCCRSCNSAKRAKDPDEWIDSRISSCHPALIDVLVVGMVKCVP